MFISSWFAMPNKGIAMKKINTIIKKEWMQVFKNRMVLFSVLFMPLVFTTLPLIMLGVMGGQNAAEGLTGEMPMEFARVCQQGMNAAECSQVFIVTQFMLLFMMMPLIIPVSIASYSIVGEKTTRSLEPLLATPITTAELLVGKNLAAAIPAILATWLGFLIYAIGVFIIVDSQLVLKALFDPMWLLAVIVVGPLMAILSVNFSLIVSSRVTDPRVAEQLSAIVILPLLLVFFAQISGLFLINQQLIVLMGLILLVLDILILYLSVRLFQRENILTRWK
jgi:ABC-2 type transport system permease protein